MVNRSRVTLDALANSGLTVELNGEVYPVRTLDGFGYQLLATATDTRDFEKMCKIAARCLYPKLTFAQVFGTEEVPGLSMADIGRVIAVGSGQIEAVEALASPNSGAAAKRTGTKQSARV